MDDQNQNQNPPIANLHERATAQPGDTFRAMYRELTDAEKAAVEDIKKTAEEFEALLNAQIANGKDGRHLALAKTKLEEAVMWAVKAITK